MASMNELVESSSPELTQSVTVGLAERSYDIRIGEGLIDRLGEETADLLPSKAPAVIVTDEILGPLWGERAKAGLARAGAEAHLCVLPEGESAKSMDTLGSILDFLVERRAPRQTLLFALGGGVIGDLAGFAAAIYHRGIPFVQVPTSLLAMVDASAGGKTAVNHPKGKNLIGAFHQPRRVLIDMQTLATLPKKHFLAGLAEVVKHGVIRDADLFEFLEGHMERVAGREARLLGPTIRRNCEIKAAVVEEDERESDVRAILNFGHTIGHAVEILASASGMLHGEAVSIGMVGASGIALKMGLWTEGEDRRLRRLLQTAGLPVKAPDLDRDALIDRMMRDKKVVDGKLRFVLPEAIGRVAIRDDVPEAILREILEEV